VNGEQDSENCSIDIYSNAENYFTEDTEASIPPKGDKDAEMDEVISDASHELPQTLWVIINLFFLCGNSCYEDVYENFSICGLQHHFGEYTCLFLN